MGEDSDSLAQPCVLRIQPVAVPQAEKAALGERGFFIFRAAAKPGRPHR
jgi:hypothetical protein